MGISKQLIERFFQGDCSEAEKEQVMEFFKNNPEKLAQYLTEDSWKKFAPDTRQGAPSEKMRSHIEEQTGILRTPVRRIHYGWVAAASVVLVAACFYLLQRSAGHRGTKPVIAATTPSPAKKEISLKEINNTTAYIKNIVLPDGSKVELAGASKLSFNDPFINRDLFLEGQAVFTVHKDNTKPFVVHSKGISTTALGTVFSVSDKTGMFTTVHLFSGRIVIKKEGGGEDKSFKNIYLLPGQQLVINKENFSVQIKTIRPPAVKTSADSTLSSPQQDLKFANRPLTEIFALLQKEYHVSITYDAAALVNMTFTGRLNRAKESLESFLNTVCDLNELSLKKISDNSFSIQVK